MVSLGSRCNHSNRQSFIRSADVRGGGLCSVSRFYETEPKADDTEYVLGFYLSAVQVGTRRVSETQSTCVHPPQPGYGMH